MNAPFLCDSAHLQLLTLTSFLFFPESESLPTLTGMSRILFRILEGNPRDYPVRRTNVSNQNKRSPNDVTVEFYILTNLHWINKLGNIALVNKRRKDNTL